MRSRLGIIAALVALVLLVTFWVWALFFADKTAVNKIADREWSARAETICAATKVQLRELDRRSEADLDARADLVVQSTDLMSTMLDDLMAVPPTDPKGAAIVPDWIADYRTLLNDRYVYAQRLRDGDNIAFRESAVEGVPITERIETFAGDNDMPSCSPPRGSVL